MGGGTTLPHQRWCTAGQRWWKELQSGLRPPSTLTHLWASHVLPCIYTPSLGASSWKPLDWDRSQLRNCSGASAKTSFSRGPEHFSPSDPVFNPFPLWAFPPLLPTIPPPSSCKSFWFQLPHQWHSVLPPPRRLLHWYIWPLPSPSKGKMEHSRIVTFSSLDSCLYYHK